MIQDIAIGLLSALLGGSVTAAWVSARAKRRQEVVRIACDLAMHWLDVRLEVAKHRGEKLDLYPPAFQARFWLEILDSYQKKLKSPVQTIRDPLTSDFKRIFKDLKIKADFSQSPSSSKTIPADLKNAGQ